MCIDRVRRALEWNSARRGEYSPMKEGRLSATRTATKESYRSGTKVLRAYAETISGFRQGPLSPMSVSASGGPHSPGL